MTVGVQLLTAFAGVGNTAGVECLLDLGVPVDAPLPERDGYWELAAGSTALHVAAWRARHDTVHVLVSRGARVSTRDGAGHTPLQLAVKACTSSWWQDRRQPHSVAILLEAGADAHVVPLPTGYPEVDRLLEAHRT